MGELLKKDLFGFPPFRMKRTVAAYYCGMSESAFDRAVGSGTLPEGKSGDGGRFWLRAELERAMVDQTPTPRNFGQKI